jgi:hypothetical protein
MATAVSRIENPLTPYLEIDFLAFNGRTLIPDYAEFMNACLGGGLPLTPSQRSVRM